MSGPGELLDLGRETALEAGCLLVEGRRRTVEVAETKSSPTDVVTAVDLASEQLIRERILAARPDDGFLGEEGDDLPGTTGVRWVVDPIDGTVNYLYGIQQFAVSIAAEVDGEVVAAVVHNPVNGETFTAAHGSGAWLGGHRLTGSRCDRMDRALVGTGFSYESRVRAAQAAETAALLPHVRDVRRMGSAALDLCFVACGRYDAYVERGLNPWDLAAGRLVVTEAGGRVDGLQRRPPGKLLVTAASTQLHDAFQKLLLSSGYADWPLADWPHG